MFYGQLSGHASLSQNGWGGLRDLFNCSPYFMVFNRGFISAWPAQRVQGWHCFLALWFHGCCIFRYGRSFVLFGFDEEGEDQRVWVIIQWLPDMFACAISAWLDLSVLNTNDTWTRINDGWGENVCEDFFSLQKVVISHFDWGLKLHNVLLRPQKYHYGHGSHVWQCYG